MLLGRTLCELMDQVRPKTLNSLAFFLFFSILLKLCIPNDSNKTYHNTGESQLSSEHIGVLMVITLFQFMEQLRRKTVNPLECFVLYILLIYVFLMFQTNYIVTQEKINYLQITKEVLVSAA